MRTAEYNKITAIRIAITATVAENMTFPPCSELSVRPIRQ
jgi:hypothetical protein